MTAAGNFVSFNIPLRSLSVFKAVEGDAGCFLSFGPLCRTAVEDIVEVKTDSRDAIVRRELEGGATEFGAACLEQGLTALSSHVQRNDACYPEETQKPF